MAVTASKLPPEIWKQIVDSIPANARRACLFVSNSFHDHAVRSLFSFVTIQFGLHYEDTDTPYDELRIDEKESEEHELSRAWDILHYIAHTPLFAGVIQELVVLSFSRGSAVFERRLFLC